MSLQDRVVAYHEARFPVCTPHEVILKAMAELGEVADAAQIQMPRGDLVEEAADVVITMFALTGRWYGANLLDAVEAKLGILSTPGAHRASLAG